MLTKTRGSRERLDVLQFCSRARVNTLANGTLDRCIALETFSGAACFHIFRWGSRWEEFRQIFSERAKAAPLQLLSARLGRATRRAVAQR